MSAVRSEIYEALRDLGAAEDKAIKAATVFGQRDEDLTKAVTEMRLDLAGVKGEQILHRCMLGFSLATNVAVVFKLFSH